MNRMPVPKPRRYNPEHDYTIRVGEHPIRMQNFVKFIPWLPPRMSHLTISGHDPSGEQLWEMNGLPTRPDGQPTEKTVGALFDRNDTLGLHENTSRHGRFGGDVVNRRPVFWGSREEMEDRRSQLQSVGEEIEARNLPYRAWDQNSNSAVGTQLEEAGFDKRTLLRNGGFRGNVPGYLKNLLRGERRRKAVQPNYDHSNR